MNVVILYNHTKVCCSRSKRSIMSFYIPEIVVYMIATVSMILALIDLSKIEKKREQEEKNYSDV